MIHELVIVILSEDVEDQALESLTNVFRMLPRVVLWQPEPVSSEDASHAFDQGRRLEVRRAADTLCHS